ncbi:TPA: hypothetical protein N0F65_000832 [Lagenidium giganteum]|uniref:Polycystin cation channel PKD1/PKD2 domain-containing protein n=1 Tax=Lagenidium giganteum TaxID=4803 RepID=A0AAV2YZS6_9STRA|nr:TPA: hypothetical protein N0F65_000832 [Lagenidium giganteum]
MQRTKQKSHHFMKLLTLRPKLAVNCCFKVAGCGISCKNFMETLDRRPNYDDEWTPQSTALRLAAARSSMACCEMLVRYGADMMIRDSYGRLPVQEVQNDDDATRLFFVQHMHEWDADMFQQFCQQGRTAALRRYLDNFRIVPNPPLQTSHTKVYYHDQGIFYGPPWLPINRTPIAQVLTGAQDVPTLVDHPVLRRVLECKWPVINSNVNLVIVVLFVLFAPVILVVWALMFHVKIVQLMVMGSDTWSIFFNKFGGPIFVTECCCFLTLLVTTYSSWVTTTSTAAWGLSSVLTGIFLLLEAVDFYKRGFTYLRDFTNWINLTTYIGILALSVMASYHPDSDQLDLARAVLLVLLFFCALEYLRLVPLTSLLITITFKMVKDVSKFLALYSVFQLGFSGSFYLLFRNDKSRYDTYGQAFLATFYMLFGDFDTDLFMRLNGVKAVVANALVLLYLVGAMVMLMNLLIAMMSTSYEKVMDSAMVERTIGRAEAIVRMESLLPHRVRTVIFEHSCSKETYQRLRKLHEEYEERTAQIQPWWEQLDAEDDSVCVDVQPNTADSDEDPSTSHQLANTTLPPLRVATMKAKNGSTATEAIDQRPVLKAAVSTVKGNATNRSLKRTTEAEPARGSTSKQFERQQANGLRHKYTRHNTEAWETGRLDDCECVELVEGNTGEQVEVRHVDEVQRHISQLKASIGHLQKELQSERESQRQVQLRLKEEIRAVREKQHKSETELKDQTTRLQQTTESIFTTLIALQQQLTHNNEGMRS